jgi:hypothetical protein
MRLSKESTKESQRLEALKLAWTSKQRADAIRTNWGRDHDKECGALLEMGQIVIPFNKGDPGSKKKSKSIRKAMYVTARVGSTIKDSECFIVNNTVTEIRLNDLLRFDNVAPGFICTIQVYGLDLPEKEKIKYLRHDAGFELWASVKLKQEDMTGKLQNRSLQIGQRAPRIPKLFGTIEMKLSGAIPVFCDIIKEGFLNMWTEEDGPQWKMLWVILKNGRLRGGKDPRFTSKTANFQVEITNGLKISESTRKRPNSFQLRDFSGRTILAASSKDEMSDWIKTIRKHKEYLKRWGRLKPDEDEGTSDVESDSDLDSGNELEQLKEIKISKNIKKTNWSRR